MAGADATRSRGPACGDATVEPDKHVDTGLTHISAVRSQREPSSALRRAIHRTTRDGTCSALQRARRALGTQHDGDYRPVFGRELVGQHAGFGIAAIIGLECTLQQAC